MSQIQIEIGAQTITLVQMPATPGFADVQLTASDTVGSTRSPFTGQTQTQSWPGADFWGGTVTLPPLTRMQSAQWTSFLMQLRGMSNAFMLSDPLALTPQGRPQGTPVANTAGATGNNAAMTTTLFTRGWKANAFRLLLPGDNVQVGFRLHRVLDQVNSDANGDASINIWPSLREVPVDASPIILNNPAGLFRLAKNDRIWQISNAFITTMSFQVTEYR